MTNLLPPQAKKRLINEYYLRTASVFLIFTSITILILIVLFSPSFLFLLLQEADIKNELGAAATEVAEVSQATVLIREANIRAQLYSSQSKEELFSVYIEKIKDLAGNDIRFNGISMVRDELMNVEQINFTAIANTRQGLISFLDKLNDYEGFGEFSFPIANLSQANNIEFTLSVPIIINSI